jgi:predicted alpha-1,2-mannosidase
MYFLPPFGQRNFACASALLYLLCAGISQGSDAVDEVSPIIGTGYFGKTYPGVVTPGGMVQLSPDTATGEKNTSGYRDFHKTIQGFSFTHMTGVGWYGELGNFLVMPTTGPLKTWYGETDHPGTGYLSSFSKNSEIAQAGYYAVTLDDYHVRAEATAAPHSGILRFTFGANPQSRIQIDLARRVGGTSLRQKVTVTNDHTIEGFIECTPAGGGWGHGKGNANYTVFYHAEFSKPFGKFGVWSATLPPGPYNKIIETAPFAQACQDAKVIPSCREMEGQHLGFYSEFPTTAGESISVKVGISFVSIAGASANLGGEILDWDFDQVRQNNRKSWAHALSRISIEGGTAEQKTAFYTALYHALLEPEAISDCDGHYPAGGGKIGMTTAFTKRSIFSGWDVYRSEFPLLTLIAPNIVNDAINSWIDMAEQSGKQYFERWELLNAYTGCMNGNPAVVILNDAYQKGIRNYDVAKAYQYAVNTCEKFRNDDTGYSPGDLSKTLEYDNDDWNLSRLAASLGHQDDATKYAARSQTFRDVFDAAQPWTYDEAGADNRPEWKGWFRARGQNGDWAPWLGLCSPKTVTEASVYQQGWFVPEDVPALIQLLGGNELFIAKLSDFFDRTPNVSTWNGPLRPGSNDVLTPYYNHPNEPVHLVPFLFNRAGAPWLTQKWVRVIDQSYKAGPDGLCGDEDAGQMSAWFILAACGLHQACPGDLRYEIFTPLFDRITFHLGPKVATGTTFTVTAKNNSPQNIYIQSAKLNGQRLDRCWITYQEITAGGSLDLVLGPQPNKTWGLASR